MSDISKSIIQGISKGLKKSLNEFIDPANYDDRFIIFITNPNNDNNAAVLTGNDLKKISQDIFEQLIKFNVKISDDDLRYIQWSVKTHISALKTGDAVEVYENGETHVYAIRVKKNK